MGYFDNINFEITLDSSVGLYDKKIGDIFHSRSGALKEAKDKFINPILNHLAQFSDDINILDICYGIGYNTKSALEYFKNYNLKIDALEYNNTYILLSPFIKDNIENNNLKTFLLYQIFNSNLINEDFQHLIEALSNSYYDEFISDYTKSFIQFFKNNTINNSSNIDKSALLHNIYYNYISESMKSGSKLNNYKNSEIKYYIGDARKTILDTKSKYDIVFLDAFSPQKDPTLWTIDFLSVVKSKMKQNSILVSYSKSVPFRSALIELGFNVGKTIVDNTDMGTAASLNSIFINNKLSKTDFDIIETRSGIPYRDINLSLQPSDIIINRSIEGAVSQRISRTQFNKAIL